MRTLNSTDATRACWVEHEVLEHIKGALRVTLRWDAPAVGLPRKKSSLCFTLRSFQRHLDRLMTMEEEGGYMVAVAEVKPNLQDRINRLESEHNGFRCHLREIVPQLEDLSEFDDQRFEELCGELVGLLNRVDRHDEEAIDLLQVTLTLDEGGEG